ncbi:heavy-metal-associated domain-containing protein [Pseudogemmobacter humi]|uniref:Heavy-metal-associated domain protein n=1 Tax=Pseudogemmobacter humi TaxID=2483812 RepID=A0A3P5XFD7_9RHOB|nr:heavy-metal-associated domain-containing protein [Pseudogemmobacter humi]VDC30120.1 Heavy-metal-associated domain protein [Pseudogemmobacter humi]
MTVLSVPDMSCGHCKASVEAALKPIATLVEVDLAAREVRAEGAGPEALIAALAAVGFPARVAG